MEVVELSHPLVLHKLSILRNEKNGTKEFRELISELATFLCYEVMKDAELDEVVVKTPMCETKGKMLNEDKYAFLPILRAGTGMLEGLIRVMPNAKIGNIGLYRNEETLKPVKYYYKMPKGIENREVIVLEKTTTSMIQKISRIFAKNPLISNGIWPFSKFLSDL